jgi:hypothetical protein
MAALQDIGGGARRAEAIEWITARVVESLHVDVALDPSALLFLLRQYRATDRADLAEALGPALARALDASTGRSNRDPEWLTLFTEASAASEDPRLPAAVVDLVAALRQEWGRQHGIATAMRSIDACLKTVDVVDPMELVPRAIDELERVISMAYLPGEGLADDGSRRDSTRGGLDAHVSAASALVTAYEATGRLPYAMLADELIQFSRRTLWDADAGGFFGGAGANEKPFVLNCEAACVLIRLHALYTSNDYAEAAVLNADQDANYGRDAERVLEALEAVYRDRGSAAAAYALALLFQPAAKLQ